MEGNEVIILNLDRPRELRLTNRVLKRFCAAYNVGLNEMETVIQRYDMAAALVYEMLHREDPNLTPEQCDDLLDECPISDIIEACAKAVAAGFDNGKDKNTNPPQ